MTPDSTQIADIPLLLSQARAGDAQALQQLFAGLYQDLCRLARKRLRAGAPITLLDTGALVHEAFERFANLDKLDVTDRAHFMSYAARVMRSIVVDAARARAAERHGGAAAHVTLNTALGEVLAVAPPGPEVMQVHEALEALAQIEPRLAQVVEMRYFGGMENAEVATALGVGLRTVERDWERARLLLYAVLRGGSGPAPSA